MLLKHVLCEQISFPCKQKDGVPAVKGKIFRKDCCFDKCRKCEAFMLNGEASIFNCPTLFSDKLYKWRQYETHTLDNGSELTELRDKTGYLPTFLTSFHGQLSKYKQHYYQYKWLNLCREMDVKDLGENELYIQTDYSAQPVLDPQDKLNSQGHGVCVLSCWIVLHSPKLLYYENEKGERISYTYYECDHIRVVTPSTGKQKDQDWYLHCKIFELLIDHYRQVMPGLKKIIVWTDGAPNQYKCRHNFYWVAGAMARYGIEIIHRFGATAQFKGVHDKIGQVAKWLVR